MVDKFPATHILAYEHEGKMKELLVLQEGEGLLTADEWAAHSIPDWTFEEDGRLYYCGVDYAEERGKCTLRPIGHRGVPLDTVLLIVKNGRHSVIEIAQVMRCSAEEISTAIATLERLGKLKREGGDRVSPIFGESKP